MLWAEHFKGRSIENYRFTKNIGGCPVGQRLFSRQFKLRGLCPKRGFCAVGWGFMGHAHGMGCLDAQTLARIELAERSLLGCCASDRRVVFCQP